MSETHGHGTRTPDTETGVVIEDISPPLCRGAFFTPLIARNLRMRLA